MSIRSSSLNNFTATGMTRELESKYDVIKAVSEHLAAIETVSTMDIQALVAELEQAQDFTGITVVTGTPASWDPVNKVLVIPQGEDGLDGTPGKSAYELALDLGFVGTEAQWIASLKGETGDRGPQGIAGLNGVNGTNGVNGQTPVLELTYNAITGDLEYEVTYQ